MTFQEFEKIIKLDLLLKTAIKSEKNVTQMMCAVEELKNCKSVQRPWNHIYEDSHQIILLIIIESNGENNTKIYDKFIL